MRFRDADAGGDKGTAAQLQKPQQSRSAAGVFFEGRKRQRRRIRKCEAGAAKDEKKQQQGRRQPIPAEPGAGHENKACQHLHDKRYGDDLFAGEPAQQENIQLAAADKTARQQSEYAAVSLRAEMKSFQEDDRRTGYIGKHSGNANVPVRV